MKIYQIKYTHYGVVKWLYTSDFKTYYKDYVENQEGKSGFTMPQKFQEKMYEMSEVKRLLRILHKQETD